MRCCNVEESVYRVPGPVRLTLAHISDLHNETGEEVLASLRRHRPGLIAVTGDLLRGLRPRGSGLLMEEQRDIPLFLARCAGLAPTYVSLGNHEWMTCPEDLDRLTATGVVLLDNRWAEAGGLVIGGLTSGYASHYRRFRQEQGGTELYPRCRYPRWRPPDPESEWLAGFEARPGFRLLLSHHPEYWSLTRPKLSERKIHLVLSGHAHGGQIRLGDWGLYAPGQGLLPKYSGGLHRGPWGCMAVSRGLANTARPIPRLFNPRELVYIEIGGE